MSNHKRTHVSKSEKRVPGTTRPSEATRAAKPVDMALSRAMRQIADGKYQKALSLLRSAGLGPQVRNATGVCLLRLGRPQEAISLFRPIVLAPGCTWTRPDAPTVYRTNYATALLMSGHPSGCEEILAEMSDATHPTVQRLTRAIDRWVNGLTFWQKLNWWVGRVEPKNCRVHLDFVPGELDVDVTLRTDQQAGVPDAPDKTAA